MKMNRDDNSIWGVCMGYNKKLKKSNGRSFLYVNFKKLTKDY